MFKANGLLAQLCHQQLNCRHRYERCCNRDNSLHREGSVFPVPLFAFSVPIIRLELLYLAFQPYTLKTTSFLVNRLGGTPQPWLDRAGRAGISSTSRLDLKR